MPGGNVHNMKAILDAGNMTMASLNETTLRILTPMFQSASTLVFPQIKIDFQFYI